MPPPKLTADQLRRIEEIEEFRRASDHLKHLVTELEGNRAGQTRTIQQLSEKIANAASQMRQRALTANGATITAVRGQGPLPHLRRRVRDLLAQLLNGARLARPVPLELGDEVLQMIGRTPELLDLLNAPELVRRELGGRHRPVNSARRALRPGRARRAARPVSGRAAEPASARCPPCSPA